MKKALGFALIMFIIMLVSACDLIIIYEPDPIEDTIYDRGQSIIRRRRTVTPWPSFETETPFIIPREHLILEPLYYSVETLLPLSTSALIDVRYVDRSHQMAYVQNRYVDVYNAYFHDQETPIEILVSAQYGQFHDTLVIALEYARVLGMIPSALRGYVHSVYVSSNEDYPVVMYHHRLFLPLHQPMETSLRTTMLFDYIIQGVYFHLDQDAKSQWHAAMLSDAVVITEASMQSSLNDFKEAIKLYLALSSHQYSFSPTEKEHLMTVLSHRFDYLRQFGLEVVETSTVPKDILMAQLPSNQPLYPATNNSLMTVLKVADPTSFLRLTQLDDDLRLTFDRRVGWVEAEAYIFRAYFKDVDPIEFVVNKEFGHWSRAYNIAADYAELFGKLPTRLKQGVDVFWIHQGLGQFGGYQRSILIHTDYAERFILPRGNLIDVLAHEAAHAVLDWTYDGLVSRDAWLEAASLDGTYFTHYAKNYPEREDIAETIVAYMLVRFYPDRADLDVIETFERTLKHRFELLDTLDITPYQRIPDE